MLGLGQEDETPAHALSLAESGTSNSCELDPIWQQSLDDGIAPHINEASEREKCFCEVEVFAMYGWTLMNLI